MTRLAFGAKWRRGRAPCVCRGSAFAAAKDVPGARPLGLHIEGPFLSPRRAGAPRRDLIDNADACLLDVLLEGDAVRLVTLAPERPDAPELIHALIARGILGFLAFLTA